MPNLKLFVERTADDAVQSASRLLPDLRALFCEHLEVGPDACQLAVVEIIGLADQPVINAELFVIRREQRTKAALQDLARTMREMIASRCGCSVAIRIGLLDPERYVALK